MRKNSYSDVNIIFLTIARKSTICSHSDANCIKTEAVLSTVVDFFIADAQMVLNLSANGIVDMHSPPPTCDVSYKYTIYEHYILHKS